jgi:hypothetical protein
MRERTLSREFLAVGVELTPAQERLHVLDTSRVLIPSLRDSDSVRTGRWVRPSVTPMWLVFVVAVLLGGAVGVVGALVMWGF